MILTGIKELHVVNGLLAKSFIYSYVPSLFSQSVILLSIHLFDFFFLISYS